MQRLVRLEQVITQLDEKLSNVQLGNVQSAAVQSAGTRQQPLHMQPQIPVLYLSPARSCRSYLPASTYRTVLPMWTIWTCSTTVSGKRQRVGSKGRLRQPLKRAPQEQKCGHEANPLILVRFILVKYTVKCVSQLTHLICNIETRILLDTGSNLSLVNAKIAKESKMPISHMKSVYVKTTCNDHVELSSYLYLTIKIGAQ